ncbi:MAG: NAD-dependent DNA ligase LigA [Clostridiales bacterium]|jgi:DNA ligase (NAD+)|nr:NAD-dependent DNA ligase LigA [Clostridiales bacterium]
MDRMTELIETLNKYAHHYYDLDDPIAADKEYDALYYELIALEQTTGEVRADSPSRRVGGEVLKGFKKYTHKSRLYSLDKCQSYDELEKWFAKINSVYGQTEYTLEYKFDGLSVNLYYKDGSLTTASTRGNGTVGEDVTAQILTVKSVPLVIAFKGECEVQGEVIMKKSALREYNKTAAEPLKNERNAAAGAIRNLDPKVTAGRRLDVFVYNVGYIEGATLKSQSEMREFLKENGFKVSDYFETSCDAKYLAAAIEGINERREGLDFLTDGAVIKADLLSIQDELGYTEKFPRFAVAYKFEAVEAATVVKDVIWQVSRTGKLNPLAVLDPVDLGGATVARATLSNISEIRRKDIRIGSRVFVRRSNDVIPEITGVAEQDPNASEITAPTTCPSCGGGVRAENVFLYCANPDKCRDVIVSKVAHYASRDAMDIAGLSEKTIEVFYDKLDFRILSDLYRIKSEDLLELDGFQDKKAENIVGAIRASLTAKLAEFIYALGIDNVGKKAAKELVKAFKTLDGIKSASAEEIETIRDFGEITAKCVYKYFNNEKNLKAIDELFSLGLTLEEEEKTSVIGGFSGRTVVLTGTLSSMKRGKAKELIENMGGETADTVSASVNLVVAGDSAGNKLDKAKKLGIEIIEEEEFLRMLDISIS